MATHDYIISNASGASVRADLNNALAAIVSNNSNATSPATTYAYQWWADTTTGQLKLRNSANSAWITIFELDGTMLMEDGTVSAPGLAFASDLNTGFFRSAADKINFATGGAERLEIGSSEVVFNDPSNDVDFRVESNGNSHMLFVDAGNDAVGIGTSSITSGSKLHVLNASSGGSPNSQYADLTVENSAAAGVSVLSGASSVGGFVFGDSGSGDVGGIFYDHSSNAMTLKVNLGEKARIDSSGRLLVGAASSVPIMSSSTGAAVQVNSNSHSTYAQAWYHGANSSAGPVISLAKSRNTTYGSYTIVNNNDNLGTIFFAGDDGSDINQAGASIAAQVDGTPGSNDMPGRLVFSTTADGASSPTERLRVDSSGNIGIGTSNPNSKLTLSTGDKIFVPTGETLNFGHTTGSVNTERMRIDSSGRLMLGTSTTRAGGIGIGKGFSSSGVPAAGTSTSSLLVGNDDGGSYGLAMGANGSGNGYIQAQRSDGNTTVYDLYIQPNGGKVGIKNTSPSSQYFNDLVIGDGTSDHGITLHAGSTNSSAIAFSDATSGAGRYAGYLQYDHSSNSFAFYVNGGNEEMRLDSDGRLLIGTATEGNASADNLTVADSGDCGITIRSGTSSQGALYFSDATSGNAEFDGYIIYSQSDRNMRFATAQSERMRTTSSGYLKAADNGTYYNAGASYHEFNQSISAQNMIFRSTHSNYGATQVQFGVSRAATSSYWFVQGLSSYDGVADTEFYIRGDGNAFADGTWSGGGADYAEYFEWSDGNTEAEDRRGISVVLDGDKIREAVAGEEPIGVISGNPSVVGDADVDRWKGKYLRDDYGSYVLDEDGYRQLNPDYDSSVEYVQREDRPEWDTVGLMGKLRIRKGQVTGARWIKMRDVSNTVEEWLVR